MGQWKRGLNAAATVLLAILAMISLTGSGLTPEKEAFYYGEGGAVAGIPAVTGTFIQPGLCNGWTDEQWDRHLDMLLSAGINIVVVQWSAETPDGRFSYAGFPVRPEWSTASDLQSDPSMLENLLRSAEKKGVKVFVGLNTAREWWNNAFLQGNWCTKQTDAGNAIAQELYELYKAKYPRAFFGWYWVWEMYGNNSGFEKCWSEMMNANLDCLDKLDPGMPVLLSPFLSSYIRLSPKQEESMWARFFSTTLLRSGDIFCPQDSAGGAAFTLSYIDAHLAAMKRAAVTVPGLLFWVNNETFTKNYKPAGMDRFVSQLFISGKYTGTHLCFAYSHYYNPGLINPSFDRAYKAFISDGSVDETPSAPPVLIAEVSGDGISVSLTVTPDDAADCCTITLYRGGRVIDVHEVLEVTTQSYTYRSMDKIKKGSSGSVYSVIVTDCWGNASDRVDAIVK